MKISIRPFLAAGGFALALLPASFAAAQGASQSQQQEARARLEQSAKRIDTELGGKTGAAQRAQLLQQQRQIDEAMRKLQAGQKVSTEEIDKILGEVSFERAR